MPEGIELGPGHTALCAAVVSATADATAERAKLTDYALTVEHARAERYKAALELIITLSGHRAAWRARDTARAALAAKDGGK